MPVSDPCLCLPAAPAAPEKEAFVPEDEPFPRFRPIFDEIAASAASRELKRELPRSLVDRLREAGFGALRIPRTLGGDGVTVRVLTRLLIELGTADSNIPQVLRAHFAFVEGQLDRPGDAAHERWLGRVVAGEIFAAAMAERTPGTETTATLTRTERGLRLDGEKYYCTGSLYASSLTVVAREGDERVLLAVPVTAPGVTILDDWSGFGQRLTASGTSRFEGVAIAPDQIIRRHPLGEFPTDTTLLAFYQLFHLTALAGIARAVLRDGVAFVQARTRTFGVPGISSPRNDPLVQRVVGRLSSLAMVAESVALATADAIDRAHEARLAGRDHAPLCLEADLTAFRAQLAAIDAVLEASTLLFEVGGASATDTLRALDRHWRNARVLASHNPAIQRERALGDQLLNGKHPSSVWKETFAAQKAQRETADA